MAETTDAQSAGDFARQPAEFVVGAAVVIERPVWRGDHIVTRSTVTRVGRRYGYTDAGSYEVKFDLVTGVECTPPSSNGSYARRVHLADGYEERKASELARNGKLEHLRQLTSAYRWASSLTDEQLDCLIGWLDPTRAGGDAVRTVSPGVK